MCIKVSYNFGTYCFAFMCAALPQPILNALPPYLNAYDLNRLHEVFMTKGLHRLGWLFSTAIKFV